MADATAARDDKWRPDQERAVEVDASTLIPQGCLVAVNASGYADNAGDDVGSIVVGIATETADNSAGAAGDEKVRVRTAGTVEVTHAAGSQTVANVNDEVFAADNQSVDIAANLTNDVRVGRITEVVDATTVRVVLLGE